MKRERGKRRNQVRKLRCKRKLTAAAAAAAEEHVTLREASAVVGREISAIAAHMMTPRFADGLSLLDRSYKV